MQISRIYKTYIHAIHTNLNKAGDEWEYFHSYGIYLFSSK